MTVEDVVAARAKALALHHPIHWYGARYCAECDQTFPCRTVRALTLETT